LITLLALSLVLAPPPVAPSPTGLTVKLVQKKRVRLVEWYHSRREPGEVLLDGVYEITVTNTSDTERSFRDLEVHGLRFQDVKTGARHVMVHPCQCARDAKGKRPKAVTLAPGAKHTILLDQFGCKSSWNPPPPGRYDVTYRVAPPAARRGPPPTIPEAMKACREHLPTDEFWKGATSSNSLKLRLKRPVRRRAR